MLADSQLDLCLLTSSDVNHHYPVMMVCVGTTQEFHLSKRLSWPSTLIWPGLPWWGNLRVTLFIFKCQYIYIDGCCWWYALVNHIKAVLWMLSFQSANCMWLWQCWTTGIKVDAIYRYILVKITCIHIWCTVIYSTRV